MSNPRTPLVWNEQLNRQQRLPNSDLLRSGAGYIRIVDVNGQDGVVGSKTYQDPAETIIQSCTSETLNVRLSVESSYPLVSCLGTQHTLTKNGSRYEGVIDVTLTEEGNVLVYALNGDGHPGAYDSVTINIGVGPEILSLSFTGTYPAGQTELKAGDTFQITGTTDTPADAIEIIDVGAFVGELVTITEGTGFTITGTIANRGMTAQALAARVQARNSSGIFGATRDTNADGGSTDAVDLVTLCNLYPTLTLDSITYPVGQQALKDSESATVAVTSANLDIIAYSSPTAELSITNPNTDAATKTVTRIAGSYNVTTDNLTVTATRSANGASVTTGTVVQIAHADPVITVSTPHARLRSGGNAGTSAQDYTITLSANQALAVPTLEAPASTLSAFAGSGGTYTATLTVHDDDVKGVYSWQNLSATSLSGKVVTVITNGDTYELGGFVQRILTVGAWPSREADIGTEVVDTAKLVCSNLSEGGSGSENYSYSATTDEGNDTYTILNGDKWHNNDTNNAVSNTSGTMQIELEEGV